MDEYPKMLFRDGAEFLWDGRGTDALAVASAGEEASALADGWKLSADYLASDPAKAVAEKDILDRTAKEIVEGLPHLTLEELEDLKAREEGGKTRKGVMAAIDAEIEKKLEG